ncbi:MAG: hypothetical protein K1X61_15715 [Chitinophagales bacterium]|nr:hypothetical protein [Chitinophagales bacterium]
MKLFISQIILLLLLLLCCSANSQTPVYKNYTVNDGLPSQVVYCALQDHQGYMWFGTDAGVSRFDGNHFQNFTSKDGLSDNEVLKIYQDSKHRIWFLMLNGTLSYFLNGRIYSQLNDKNLSGIQTKLELMSFLEDKEHNLWFGSAGKELIFISNKDSCTVLRLDTLKSSNSSRLVFPLQVDSETMIVIGSYLYSANDLHFIQRDTLCYIGKNIPFVVADRIDLQSVAISYKDGIRCLTHDTSQIIIPKSMIPEYETIQRMYIDRKKGIWLLTSNLRTMYYAYKDNKYSYQTSYLDGTYMGAVIIDSEGNKWFCTVGQGVKKISNDAEFIKVFEPISVLQNKEIWSVNIDIHNNVWFGSGTRNVYRITNDSMKIHLDIGNLDYHLGRITRIDFDHEQVAWCSASNGLVLISCNSLDSCSVEEVETINGLRNFNAKYVGFDQNGNAYFSSFRGIQKVYKKDGRRIFTKYIPETLDPDGRVFCLFFDKNNILWYEKFNILTSYNGFQVRKYNELASIIKSQITNIVGIHDSSLILSTNGNGVLFFKNGKIINHLTMADGLAGDLCRKVYVDSNIIYVATNQGFTYFNYDNNHISGIKTITTSDGIVSNDIKDICAKGNKIYLATSAGLCIVNKEIAQLSSIPPPVYITSIATLGGITTDLQHMKFLHNTDFNVNYIAITFVQPEKISYQYKVTGIDKQWIESKNASISFSTLSPGDYTFLLRAKKYNSDWSQPAFFQFTIIPAIWQQWWFRIYWLYFFSTIIYYAVKLYSKRNYQEQLHTLVEEQVLADERNRIAADMHDDLGADLSNLLLMTRIVDQEASVNFKEKTDMFKFEDFAAGLSSKVDEIIWALNSKNDSLEGLIHFISDYATNLSKISGISTVFNFPELIPGVNISAAFRRNIFLVAKETLNNIIRHARATQIVIDVKIDSRNINILISENGAGFNIKEISDAGDGIINMHKRMRAIGGDFQITSSPGNGSNASINAPFN